jgi:transposase-like protein
MRAYSLDLRQKVVAAVERGDSTIEEVAASFGVGLTFVKKMLRQHRKAGDLTPARTAAVRRRGSPPGTSSCCAPRWPAAPTRRPRPCATTSKNAPP